MYNWNNVPYMYNSIDKFYPVYEDSICRATGIGKNKKALYKNDIIIVAESFNKMYIGIVTWDYTKQVNFYL